jgi:hypothetical protein
VTAVIPVKNIVFPENYCVFVSINILDFAFRIGRLDDFARAAAFVM